MFPNWFFPDHDCNITFKNKNMIYVINHGCKTENFPKKTIHDFNFQLFSFKRNILNVISSNK